MARSQATLGKAGSLDQLKDVIRAKVTGSTVYVSKLRKLAEKKAKVMEEVIVRNYNLAISEIDEIVADGHTGGQSHISRLNTSVGTVPVSWKPLTHRWLLDKRLRSGTGKRKINRNRAAYGSGTTGRRGRSYGPDMFWLDQRKFSTAFKAYLNKGDAKVEVKLKELKDGTFEVKFNARLSKLPASYLDRAIRRSLMQGAEGAGSLGGLLDFNASELVTASVPRGIARGMWPEAIRPTMRPIAQRIGRAMKEQIIRSLNGRR